MSSPEFRLVFGLKLSEDQKKQNKKGLRQNFRLGFSLNANGEEMAETKEQYCG